MFGRTPRSNHDQHALILLKSRPTTGNHTAIGIFEHDRLSKEAGQRDPVAFSEYDSRVRSRVGKRLNKKVSSTSLVDKISILEVVVGWMEDTLFVVSTALS